MGFDLDVDIGADVTRISSKEPLSAPDNLIKRYLKPPQENQWSLKQNPL